MSIKAAFFDIDGTLFSHKSNQVPPSAVDALNMLRERGILTIICTGRHTGELDKLDLKGLIFDYVITLNGQMIRNAEGTLIASFPFKTEEIAGIRELFDSKEISIMVVEEDDYYVNTIREPVISANKAVAIPIPKTGEMKEKPIYQLICYGSEDEINRVAACINAKAVWWNERSADIIPISGGKDKGIRSLIDILGLKEEHKDFEFSAPADVIGREPNDPFATFTIDKEDLSFFDPEKHAWVAEPGKFKALIGSASDDIRTEVTFELE